MTTRPIDTVLFDLDGTLTDSGPGILASIQHALRQTGAVVPEVAALTWCIGPPLSDSFPVLLKTADAAAIGRAIASYRERFSTIGYLENRVYDDVPMMLAAVRAAGCRIFVATSKPRIYAERIVAHFALDRLVDAVYGSELDGGRSDKTELIGHILNCERVDPALAVMVGDRSHDMVGARNCGLRGVGVTYGYGTADELRSHGAFALAASPMDVVRETVEVR